MQNHVTVLKKGEKSLDEGYPQRVKIAAANVKYKEELMDIFYDF